MEKALLSKLLPVVGILLVIVALVGGGYWWGHGNERDAWTLKWSQRDRDDLIAKQKFTEEQRRLELQRQGEIDAIQKEAAADVAAAQRNTAAARAESVRLQSGIERAISQLNSGSGDPGTAAGRAARDKTGLLLAQLYREIDDAAGRYAAEADRAFLAGATCERAWDTLKGTH